MDKKKNLMEIYKDLKSPENQQFEKLIKFSTIKK